MAIGLAALAAAVVIAAPARAASGTWERAWGKDVVSGGGRGFEVCLVAPTLVVLDEHLVLVPESCQQGSNQGGLGGELGNPYGVATDPAGNVYVVDRTKNRIQKFDSFGNWERAWGKDVVTGGGTGFEVCTAAASCKQGGPGGRSGEFNPPMGVAADPPGNVYVADASAQPDPSNPSNQRIQKFDSSGNFLRAWGKDVDVGGGTGFEVCMVAASCKTEAFGGCWAASSPAPPT